MACDPKAIPEAERPRWLEAGMATYGQVEAIEALADGFAFRLPASALVVAADYVNRDRLCCPFIEWSLTVEQHSRALWLVVRGPEGLEALVRDTVERYTVVPEAVARAAGFDVSRRRAFDPTDLV